MTPHIDKWLPQFDKVAAYSIIVNAPPQLVYDTARRADFSGSLVARILFSLRSFDFSFSKQNASLKTSLEGLLTNGFVLLDENPPTEIVLGLVGRFWTASGCIQRIDAAGFALFEQAGFAKATWNFLLTPLPNGATILSTETRIRCTDEKSRRKFNTYWFFIGPFSGLIRREMLRTIKRHVETKRRDI